MASAADTRRTRAAGSDLHVARERERMQFQKQVIHGPFLCRQGLARGNIWDPCMIRVDSKVGPEVPPPFFFWLGRNVSTWRAGLADKKRGRGPGSLRSGRRSARNAPRRERLKRPKTTAPTATQTNVPASASERCGGLSGCEMVGLGVPKGAGALLVARSGVWGQAGSHCPRGLGGDSSLH